MTFKNEIKHWGILSLMTFLLYEIIWSVISDATIIPDDIIVHITDMLYCSIFVFTSMVICGAMSCISFFRRMDFGSQTCLCVMTLLVNLLLAYLFERLYNNIMETDDLDLENSSLYVFCIVATLFTLVHHTSRYFSIIIRQKDQLAELQKRGLKSKLDPHFVFNSLSTLTELIHESPEAAEQYTIQFSRIYRHLLATIDNNYVTVGESISLVSDYVAMQKYRVEGDIEVEVQIPEKVMERKLFPLTLQTLVENAIKHNAVRKGEKLEIAITQVDDKYIRVGNTKSTKTIDKYSSCIGLQTLRERYRLEQLPEPIVVEKDDYYEVRIRLIDEKK